MSEDVQGLIEKIQQEGLKVAEDKAKGIEAEAMRRAQEIIEKAKKDAADLVQSAKNEAEKSEQATKSAIVQAGRDLLLELRKEINAMLERVITQDLRAALKTDDLTRIIGVLIKDYSHPQEGKILLSMSQHDAEKIEKAFFSRLGHELKRQIILRPSEDVQSGFAISFDEGKSHFDFTDKALAEYIGSYLKPKLKDILDQAVK